MIKTATSTDTTFITNEGERTLLDRFQVLIKDTQFFGRLNKKINNLDRQQDYDKYMTAVAANAKEVREKILKFLIVRRTKSEIVKELSKEANPLRILCKLKTSIPFEFFKEPIAESAAQTSGPREGVLSEYLIGE